MYMYNAFIWYHYHMQHTSDTTINVGYMYMAQWLIITCVEDSSLILMSLKPNPQKSDTHSSWVQNPKASCLSTTFLLGCYYSQSTRVISWCFCDWPRSQSVWRWHGLCCHVRTLDEVAIIDLDIYYHFHITTLHKLFGPMVCHYKLWYSYHCITITFSNYLWSAATCSLCLLTA